MGFGTSNYHVMRLSFHLRLPVNVGVFQKHQGGRCVAKSSLTLKEESNVAICLSFDKIVLKSNEDLCGLRLGTCLPSNLD